MAGQRPDTVAAGSTISVAPLTISLGSTILLSSMVQDPRSGGAPPGQAARHKED